MEIDQALIDQRVAGPAEALNIEVKNWIDPSQPEGQAKIVKAALALRNRNGGELVVGFNDRTMLPEATGAASDTRNAFHPDLIQQLVTKFASDPFPVGVGFGRRDGREYPVIVIPTGVRIPVAATRDIIISGKQAVKIGAVYFRSLRSNGRVSSSEARPSDWRDIMEICFNNREADFGAFFRRQLSGVTPEVIKEILSIISPEGVVKRGPTPCERAAAWLTNGEARYTRAVKERRTKEPKLDTTFLKYGAAHVSLVICGNAPDTHHGEAFLNLIARSNPNYTGWPIWLDSRTFTDPRHHPYYREGAWESLIISLSQGFSDHIDFSVMEASGQFYLLRVLQDDFSNGRVQPGTVLDPWLHLYRTTEALAVGLAFAKAMGYPVAETMLAFTVKWTGLEGRTLSGWASKERAFFTGVVLSGHFARDREVSKCVEVPLETAPSALAPFVATATRELFLAFNGFEMPISEVEKTVTELLKRRG